MNVFERIDALILSFFTKVSHKFQRNTGLTNYFLAKCCLTMIGMNMLLNIANYWFPLLMLAPNLILLFCQFLVVIMISFERNKLDEADKTVLHNNNATLKPDLILSEKNYFLRLLEVVLATMALSLVVQILIGTQPVKNSRIFEILGTGLFWPLITCYDYFTNVVPLPPSKSKVKQWLESFGKVLTPIPVRGRK